MALNAVNCLVPRPLQESGRFYISFFECNINIHRDMCLILNTWAIEQTLGVAYVCFRFLLCSNCGHLTSMSTNPLRENVI